MLNKTFLKDAGERAIKSFAQGMLTWITLEGATLGSVKWGLALSTGVLMALYSILTSIVSYKFGDEGTASIVK